MSVYIAYRDLAKYQFQMSLCGGTPVNPARSAAQSDPTSDTAKLEFAYLRRSSLIKHTLTTTIITANTSEATNCPIAAAGIGCNGHGSIKLARQALNIHTTVRK